SSSSASAAAAAGAAPLRACSTSGCRVSKYVEVTKRKCSQFVSAPYIMPKPLVVNGKTSIFQVGGEMARLYDIDSLAAASGGGATGKPVYRIKPGTHAHVINYVFIDEGSDSMEKAKSEDQESMRLLIDSQRESATAKLQKLMATHRGVPQPAADSTTAAAVAAAPPPPAEATTTAAAVAPTSAPAPPPALAPAPAASLSSTHVTTPQIHPNLCIASVEGAMPALPATVSTAPIASVAPQAARRATGNSVDELQAEILKLRRSVARLGAGVRR
ncbi:hypothetical protein KR222_010085, partial [Zaprionus bogoriensis]